jgi:hypothetical protein
VDNVSSCHGDEAGISAGLSQASYQAKAAYTDIPVHQRESTYSAQEYLGNPAPREGVNVLRIPMHVSPPGLAYLTRHSTLEPHPDLQYFPYQ